ncbi:MAG: chorismate mutase [Clostridioides sp.]|jgi:chorismate mutase/prephenate dehydratase|nr:chorismate mutase [Clostridioides sp.]
MKNLDSLRKKIDEIDSEIVNLFEARLNLAVEIAKFKEENEMPIFQGGREEEVVQNAVKHLENKDYSDECSEFIQSIMNISKKVQEKEMN